MLELDRWQPSMFPVRLMSVALLAGVLLVGCTHTPSVSAQRLAASDTRVEVTCAAQTCEMRVLAQVDGEPLRSDPLPFAPVSSAVESVELPPGGDATLGYLLPDAPARPLSAWVAGLEERSVLVGIEVVEAAPGQFALLVHQSAGYEHVKRAHVVLAVAKNSLANIAEFVEGAGPATISVAPVAGGLRVERSSDGVSVDVERYSWRWAASARQLRLVKLP